MSVGTVSYYGLECLGFELQLGQDFPLQSRLALGPTQPPVQWVPWPTQPPVQWIP